MGRLGPQFETMGTGTGVASGANQTTVVNQIEHMLDCPCVSHNDAWGGLIDVTLSNAPWWADYTYNECLGQEQSIPSPKTSDGIALNIVKAADVPRTTLVAVGDRKGFKRRLLRRQRCRPVDTTGGSITNANTPAANNVGVGEVGVVHKYGLKTNMLFADGVIITDNANKLFASQHQRMGNQFPWRVQPVPIPVNLS